MFSPLPAWRRFGAAVLLPGLLLGGCGLLPSELPATPVPSRGSQTPLPSPSVSQPTVTASASSTALPTYSAPTEPACAIPEDAPDSVAGADGPTLTVKQVEKAWRASESGKSLGVNTGTHEREAVPPVRPASVVVVRGAPWVALDIMEWSSVSTIVFADPGVAAAKLAAVRTMVRQPCSYRFGSSDVVARLSEDRPDLVQVTGLMGGLPITDTFVRYGNTVTHSWMTLVPRDANDVRTMVLDTLGKA